MTNRLAQAKSLYLRKHAENPIDWWSWCDEALATAKVQNKPIFLSIGYSSCHWCTVMEGEAFSDLAVAEYMNANFLPIKVDREERPDIDSIYMQALQMMSGQGLAIKRVYLSRGSGTFLCRDLLSVRTTLRSPRLFTSSASNPSLLRYRKRRFARSQSHHS